MADDGTVDADELLRRLFSGRRKFPRLRLPYDVQISVPVWGREPILARTVDVSRGGALVAILDPGIGLTQGIALAQAMEGSEKRGGPADVTLSFRSEHLRLHARVARLVLGAGQDAQLLLGLEFVPTLGRREANALRIATEQGDAALEASTSQSDDEDGTRRSNR